MMLLSLMLATKCKQAGGNLIQVFDFKLASTGIRFFFSKCAFFASVITIRLLLDGNSNEIQMNYLKFFLLFNY